MASLKETLLDMYSKRHIERLESHEGTGLVLNIKGSYPAPGQSKRDSLLETSVNIVVGVTVGFLLNILVLPLFGYNVNMADASGITLVFTTISFIRSYCMRRVFNYLHIRRS